MRSAAKLATRKYEEALSISTGRRMNFYETNPTLQVCGSSNLDWKENPDFDWKNFEPLSKGDEFLSFLPQSASFLIVNGDSLVWESYYNRTTKYDAKNIHSVSKSILSALCGIAREKEDIESFDDSITKYLHSDFNVSSRNSRINIEHLLTLSSGLDWEEDSTEPEIEEESSWVQAILDRDLPLVPAPGTVFNYSTGDTHLLAATLTGAIEPTLEKYAQEHLFDPLGIKPTRWAKDPDEYSCGGFNFYMSPRELAKLGRLFLQGGMWGEQQVVPASWFEDAWSAHDPIDWGFGYLWYLLEIQGRRVLKMWGHGGQFVYVLPDWDVAIVITADTTEGVSYAEELNGDRFIKEYVIPALPDPSLPDQ